MHLIKTHEMLADAFTKVASRQHARDTRPRRSSTHGSQEPKQELVRAVPTHDAARDRPLY